MDPWESAPKAAHVLTVLPVEDIRRSVTFYREAFGWGTRVETPEYVELQLPGGQALAVSLRDALARNTGRESVEIPYGALRGAEIHLLCEDLLATAARVKASGGRLLSKLSRRFWGDEATYFADPDGNVIVLFREAE